MTEFVEQPLAFPGSAKHSWSRHKLGPDALTVGTYETNVKFQPQALKDQPWKIFQAQG